MSHTTTIKVEISDVGAIMDACTELGFECSTAAKSAKLYDRTVDAPMAVVKPPQFAYPIVVKDGALLYDTYSGRWGDEAHVTSLRREIQKHTVLRKAREQGHSATLEKRVVDGRTKTVIRIMR